MIEIILTSGRATCGGLSSTHKNGPIHDLARKLLADHDLFETVVVRRNGARAFRDTPLWWWAKHTTSEGATSIKTVPWKPHFMSETGE